MAVIFPAVPVAVVVLAVPVAMVVLAVAVAVAVLVAVVVLAVAVAVVALAALGACDRDFFPNINLLLVVGCTLPISSAEAERSFSLMRRIKTYARSVMTEERFSDQALISMHYKEYLLMKFARHSCRPIPENCSKHPYLTIVDLAILVIVI